MNNEDKILSMLETLVAGQQATNQRLDKLEQGQVRLEQEVHKLEQGQARLEQDVNKLEQKIHRLEQELQSVKNIILRMEDEHGKKIGALFDGYSANYEIIERYDPKIVKLERAIEKLSFQVNFLKAGTNPA